MNKRILELALEALEAQRIKLDAEIEQVGELMGGIPRKTIKRPVMPTLVVIKRRSKTAAERKSQSERMKAYWAARRGQAAKISTTAKQSPAGTKRRPKTAAEKKALSLKLKEAWAWRKAAVTKK